MKISKLSLAAAISFGVIAFTSTGAFSAEYQYTAPQCDMPVVTGGACPLGPCDKQKKFVQIPDADTCTPCKPDSPCPVQGANPCDPCEPCQTGAAAPSVGSPCETCDPCDPCPTGAACPCDPCAEPDPCDPCDPCPTGAACPCDPCASSPCPVSPCAETAEPTCATCPNIYGKNFQEKQAYAYPTIYGKPQVLTGDTDNHLTQSYSYTNRDGISVARGGTAPQPTGAAASIPCMDECGNIIAPRDGINVDRNEMKMDGATCPITIHSPDSVDVLKKSLVPIELQPTGAAAPMMDLFPDVPSSYWASCDINKLASLNIIAGYPDRTYKPNAPVTRAEFASLVVAGFNLEAQQTFDQEIFTDVSDNFWANNDIDKSVSSSMMAGYPDDTFKPQNPVSRVEAIVTLSKAVDCDLNADGANKILSEYCDAAAVPGWAKVCVAKALRSGILKNTPNPTMIMPNQNASRADIASMVSGIRIALGLDPEELACGNECETGKAAFIAEEEVVKIPAISIELEDKITARANHVGEKFAARTTDCVTINGTTYPSGSKVRGQIVQVERPSWGNEGGLKIALTEIENGKMSSKLPREILHAQVQTEKRQNFVSRTFAFPFTWTGRLIGTAGRTAGGVVLTAGNATEDVINSFGIGTGEVFQGKMQAAGRSYGHSIASTAMLPVDVLRTTVSGTAGLFNVTSDELGYLVAPDGKKIATINPNEKVKIAFGCHGNK